MLVHYCDNNGRFAEPHPSFTDFTAGEAIQSSPISSTSGTVAVTVEPGVTYRVYLRSVSPFFTVIGALFIGIADPVHDADALWAVWTGTMAQITVPAGVTTLYLRCSALFQRYTLAKIAGSND